MHININAIFEKIPKKIEKNFKKIEKICINLKKSQKIEKIEKITKN